MNSLERPPGIDLEVNLPLSIFEVHDSSKVEDCGAFVIRSVHSLQAVHANSLERPPGIDLEVNLPLSMFEVHDSPKVDDGGTFVV